MKKAFFLLLTVGFVSLGMYSCQKENVQQVATPDVVASERTNYADCGECYENCNDCCLELTSTTGGNHFYFTNPATGSVTTRVLLSPGTIYVCAAGGWVGVLGNGAGSAKACSTGSTISKTAGGPNVQKQLSWDCNF
ncbi:MAG: hypothetical protein JNL02_17985 [Saprospiraceae bacterium]|nr:hypothetical protein [Saprospiraceae bacterium]